MIANNVISSVPNTSDGGYEPEPSTWANTKCWHFTPGSYILQENLAYNQLIPATDGGGNDYTIGGWFKIMYNGDMSQHSPSNYRRTIYAMFNGDSNIAESLMYGSIVQQRVWTSQPNIHYIRLASHNESTYPFTNQQLSSGGTNNWQFIIIRVKTSASDDNAAWFLNGTYASANGGQYTQNADEGNYAIKIGGENVEFYVSELGVWKDNLPEAAIASLYNNGTPISFQADTGDYSHSNQLVAYYRFGDGTGDNPASLLHDETNTDNSSTATDLTSMIGTIHEVPLQNAG